MKVGEKPTSLLQYYKNILLLILRVWYVIKLQHRKQLITRACKSDIKILPLPRISLPTSPRPMRRQPQFLFFYLYLSVSPRKAGMRIPLATRGPSKKKNQISYQCFLVIIIYHKLKPTIFLFSFFLSFTNIYFIFLFLFLSFKKKSSELFPKRRWNF